MSSLSVRLLAAVASLAVVAPAHAQGSPAPATRPAPPTCEASEHHQFDFWIGEWTVRSPAGAVLGTSRIEPVLAGCAIVEHWTGSGASRGTSLNFYDRRTGEWTQTWIDNTGSPLRLAGALRDGHMVLEGTTPGVTGSPARRQRISWIPLEGGNVRQLWETSADDGATWTTSFDGRYSRKEAK